MEARPVVVLSSSYSASASLPFSFTSSTSCSCFTTMHSAKWNISILTWREKKNTKNNNIKTHFSLFLSPSCTSLFGDYRGCRGLPRSYPEPKANTLPLTVTFWEQEWQFWYSVWSKHTHTHTHSTYLRVCLVFSGLCRLRLPGQAATRWGRCRHPPNPAWTAVTHTLQRHNLRDQIQSRCKFEQPQLGKKVRNVTIAMKLSRIRARE